MADRFPLIVDSSAQQLQELAVGDNLNLASSGLINADNIQTSGLSVVGVMTATSFSGDGSQLTNLPAAGSSTELTASGTLADGSKVIVNADGTVSVVAQTGSASPSAGTPQVFESAQSDYNSVVYDSTNQKVVIAYKDVGNSEAGTAVVGTVSGTGISFGTPVIFASFVNSCAAVYDPSSQKVVIAYSDYNNSDYGTGIVGTVSGNSISFGSPSVFEQGSLYKISAAYDSSNQSVVIAYSDIDNSYRMTAVVGTVSGTSISFSGQSTFDYGTTNSVAYDSTNQKVVFSYRDDPNSDYGTAKVGTVSSGSLSYGSPVVFNSGATNDISSVYDSTNQKIIITYRDQGNSSYGTAIVGTVSGTSISFGTPVVFNYAHTRNTSMVYDSTNGKIIIAYQDWGNNYYGTAIVGTVSGTSISFGSPIVLASANSTYISAAYDSSNGKTVVAYRDGGNSNYGTAVVFATNTLSTNLTSENYIGVSNGAYTNGQTATVQLIGSVDDAQSGLTAGQKYYVQDDGTLAESGSVLAGTAIASTKLLIKK